MSKIYQPPMSLIGTTEVRPNFKFMVVGDNYSAVTTAGYLNQSSLEGYTVSESDILQILYNFNPVTQSGSFGTFSVTITDGVITLSLSTTAPAYSIQNNNIPIWNTTTDTFNDSGITVASNIITYGYNAQFCNSNGGELTIGTDVFSGQLNIASGIGDTLSIICNGTGNNVTTTLGSSQTSAQDSTLLLSDVGDITGYVAASSTNNIAGGKLVQYDATYSGALGSAGFSLLSGTTSVFAGGATSHAFTVTGVATTSYSVCTIKTSTNNVTINKVVATANTLTITFSADPGANTTVNYIVTTP